MANLRQIAEALDAYAMRHGSYPTPTVVDSAGKPLYSWRVLILPQLGYDSLYARYDKSKAWDSPENAMLIPGCPDVFVSPQSTITTAAVAEPNYMLVTGKGTLFPPSGPLGPTDILDGPANTLLVVETAGNAVSWTQPADIDISKMNRQIGGSVATMVAVPNRIGGSHPGGATAVFADGKAAWLPDDVAPNVLQSMLTPAGGEPVNSTPYVVN
jgi:hypothetical protein